MTKVALKSKLGHFMQFLTARNSRPEVSIILPTFNESKNIEELLWQISTTMKEAGTTFECVFIDDSNDDTAKVIMDKSKSYPHLVTLIKRQGEEAKTGLTQAFRRGFEFARGQVIVCMDTDLQHPPDVIPRLMDAVNRAGVDVAVASRYVEGGSAEGLNGFFRHLVSRVTTLFVHILLPGTRATSDPMTGFFAFKPSLLQQVEFSSFGFKILVELLAGMEKPQVLDVPLIFRRRENDSSKATLRQGLIAYRDIIKLFFTGNRGSEVVRFLFSAILVSLLSFLILSFLSYLYFITGQIVPDWFSLFFLSLVSILVSIFIFSWVFSRYNYNQFTTENTILIVFHGLALVFSSWYFLSINSLYAVKYHLAVQFLSVLMAQIVLYILFRPLWQKKYQVIVNPWRWFLFFLLAILIITINYFSHEFVWWNILLLFFYALVIAQGLFALYLMIFSWEKGNYEPKFDNDVFASPRYSFTAIVPCKHETYTIADTIKAMHRIKYPEDKKEILVVIHEGTDDGTIEIVKSTIDELGKTAVKLVTYNEDPVNKPHGLNTALMAASGDFVTIFDAEDEPHPDLFSVINTELIKNEVDVVQSGVQLMNYDSNWYSTFNVLEYYFWFKSSLHFYAMQGVVPLGGVSVFFRRKFLKQVGGWDMTCLTEDAEIGMRLSQAGAKMSVIYDAKYATQEETPPTMISFIKQRTRWAQGFLQILARGNYLYFPTVKQRLLALYVLSWPIILPAVFLLLPFGIFMMLFMSLPPMIALISNVSLLLFLSFVVVQIIGFYEFTQDYNIRFPWLRIPLIIFLFYPYTLLLSIASLRAMYRQLVNINVWEKTEHFNTHRKKIAIETAESEPILIENEELKSVSVNIK